MIAAVFTGIVVAMDMNRRDSEAVIDPIPDRPLSTMPLLDSNGLNRISGAALVNRLMAAGININSGITTQEALFNATGHIRLFESSSHVGMSAFSSETWRPVYLRNGVLTLWMSNQYRHGIFGTSPTTYSTSSVRTEINRDLRHHLKDGFQTKN